MAPRARGLCASKIPDLLQRFNEARQLASEQDAKENRYKRVESAASPSK